MSAAKEHIKWLVDRMSNEANTLAERIAAAVELQAIMAAAVSALLEEKYGL